MDRAVTWVKPELVCEISFAEWTAAGLARQAIFEGLREDKKATEVKREKEISAEEVVEGKEKQNGSVSGRKTQTAKKRKT